MIRTYSERELVSLWIRERGLLPSLSVSEKEDHTPLEQTIAARIRAWYLDLLRNEDPSLLPVDDVKNECLSRFTGPNSLAVDLPARALRFVSMKMPEWVQAQFSTCEPWSARAGMQSFLQSAGTVLLPVIVESGRHLDVYGVKAVANNPHPVVPVPAKATAAADDSVPAWADPQIESLRAVVIPPDGTYILEETLLSRFPALEKKK